MREGETSGAGHKKIRKGKRLNNMKQYGFSQRSVGDWNGLKEDVTMAVHVK